MKAQHHYQCGHVVTAELPDMAAAFRWSRQQLQVPCPKCGNADHLPEDLQPKEEEAKP
jgi:hypothetical protein